MGMKRKKRKYSLKIFFTKFIFALAAGASLGVIIPMVIFAFASNKGYITMANYNELQAKETASILSAKNDIKKLEIPSGIKYLISDKEFSIMDTNMNPSEQKDALKYANGNYEDSALGKHFILVTRDKEYCILQYYVGSHFTNKWLDMNFPSPDILITLSMIINCLVIFSILVVIFAKILKKELKPVMDATLKIDEKELEFSVSESKIIEFDDILNSICEMKSSLKKSLERQWNIERQQKEQISALAHDLKTPLTIVSGNADLLSETIVNQDQEEYVNYIIESSQRMKNYIGLLIDLSKNTGEAPLNIEEITIGVFTDSIIGQIESITTMKKIKLKIDVADKIFKVNIDPVLMERAIVNVISNAVDHSQPYANITFKVMKSDDYCLISIADEGSGFTQEALKHGLDKFFMDDKSRSYQHHYGMGLYITDSIVKQHDGKVILSNVGGAKVDIYIPIKE